MKFDWSGLIELRDLCKDIVENCPLVNGKVQNGYRYENGKEIPILEDGKAENCGYIDHDEWGTICPECFQRKKQTQKLCTI